MVINDATHDDVIDLIQLGVEMFYESEHYSRFTFDGEKVYGMLNHLIDHEDGILVVARNDEGKAVGAFVGGVTEHWFGRSKVMYDNALFIHQDYRKGRLAINLINAAFECAKAKGADEAVLTNTTGVQPERVERLYQFCKMTRVGGMYYKIL